MKLREDVELGLKQVIFFLSMTKKSSPRNSSLNCTSAFPNGVAKYLEINF